MTRSLYRSLLWLHPPAFRRQFAVEMLWIFDEAAASEGAARLLADGVLSLFRQWVIGCGAWKVLIAMAAAALELLFIVPLGHVAAPVNPGPQPVAPALHGSDLAFSDGLLLVSVLLIGMIAALRVAYARTPSRH